MRKSYKIKIMNKKIIITILALLLAIFLGWYLYYNNLKDDAINLEKLKQEQPQLTTYIDDVIEAAKKLNEDDVVVSNYLVLGLAWKSLADRIKDLKIENYKSYYKQALDIYDKGIDLTGRRNTLFMVNAGNMAKYLEDYELTEDYYKEAITVAPGDVSYYVLLAELYENKMNKSTEDIVAVYDEGMKRVIINVGFLQTRKEQYLEKVNK